MNENKTFGFARNIFFPVEDKELSLLIRLGLLLCCILFNFSALRALKDSLVIPLIGAEAISFLKLWLVLPSALIFTLIYFKLSNHFNLRTIFNIFVCFFLVFFIFFAFFIYPKQDIYHLSEVDANYLTYNLPYLQWFIRLFAKWSYVLVYIFVEIWGAMIINLIFWQLTNSIFQVGQAKRLYPMLTLIGSVGLVFSGQVLIFCSDINNLPQFLLEKLATGNNYIEASIKMLVVIVTVFGIMSVLLFSSIYNYCSGNQISSNFVIQNHKSTLNVWESIKLISNSKHIFYIFILVVAYGMSINILEGPWKAKIGKVYNDPCSYINFMGKFNIWMGMSAILMNILSSSILRYLGWRISAYITPIIMGITGFIFFFFIVFEKKISLDMDVSYVAIIAGAMQNILSKSTKYSLFDSTKEMAYIPLSVELKTKGKATVEILGTKIGKSLVSLIYFVAFTIPGVSFENIYAFLMIIFMFIIVIWLIDVYKITKQYTNLINAQNN